MIYIYCAGKHGTSNRMCANCEELNRYAQKRLEYCQFGEDKPTCQKCPVHCYKADMKTKIRDVMRFSGPRIIFRNPYLAFAHLFKQFR